MISLKLNSDVKIAREEIQQHIKAPILAVEYDRDCLNFTISGTYIKSRDIMFFANTIFEINYTQYEFDQISAAVLEDYAVELDVEFRKI